MGLPLALALDAVGPPVTTLIANGFLNGQATLPLTMSLGGLESITLVPLGGLLTPLQVASRNVPLLGGTVQLSSTTFGTPTGGIIPALLNYAPVQLAKAIA